LESLSSSMFRSSALNNIFIPHSVHFIEPALFPTASAIKFLFFTRHCCLAHLQRHMVDYLERLSAITIPISIKHIHDRAFSDCQSLRFVTFAFPSQCSLIATRAFQECRQLKSVFLPSSVEVIYSKFSRSSFELPHYFVIDGPHFCEANDCLLRTNGRELIQYHGSSPTFCVSSDISVLAGVSFIRNSSLTKLTFEPQSRVTRFPMSGFCYCRELRSVQIPKSVLVICRSCFYQCSQLAEVAFESPAAIHTIKSRAFCCCRSLATFVVPSSVLTLGDSVFESCSELSSVIFEAPSHLTTIPTQLFQWCSRLTTLSLPDSVETISGSAFASCGITSVSGGCCKMFGSLLVRLGTVVSCCGSPSSIRVPGTVREIGKDAFSDLYSLNDLSFEEGTVRIGRVQCLGR
jgi:hypothetical protein